MDFQEIMSQVQFASLLWMLIVPCALMALDFLTGFANAWAKGEVISSKMRTGGVKKLGEAVVLGIGLLFMGGFNMPKAIEGFLSLYICVMELVSIAENLRDMGVTLPWIVRKGLKGLEKELNEEPQSGHPPDEDPIGDVPDETLDEDD